MEIFLLLPTLQRYTYRTKLHKAAIQEVIFEIFWKLSLDDIGFPHDPDFGLTQGVYASKIQKDFPVRKCLIHENINIRMYPLLVYQFWKEELTWPLVQLGPGVMTVNDTEKNYVWKENFLPNIKKAVQILRNSYQVDLKIERVKLQYIDAVEFDAEKESATEFVARNMKTVLRNNYKSAGVQKSVHNAQTFQLKKDSVSQLNIQNGVYNKTGNPAIIWTTAVESTSNIDFKSLLQWLEHAHKATSDTFINMLNPEFYDGFTS
ncbi:MAG: TIGR04255 family protein [Saprospiraceae bacterium]|nr:TIGR04255 family protein [Saprospiraceae bacterium]